jgi:16S rRNA (cytosine1402-N4)-methyltransferase
VKEAFEHITVLQKEAVEAILPAHPTEWPHLESSQPLVIVDCTLGGAGHAVTAVETLSRSGFGKEGRPLILVGVDRDPMALQVSKERMDPYLSALPHFQFHAVEANFSDLASHLTMRLGIQEVHGLYADFGVSSPQLDKAERGFSFLRDGPLDMRMNQTEGDTAKDLLEKLSEKELMTLFFEFGEEPRSRKLAQAICKDRAEGKLPAETTLAFADYVSRILGYPKGKTHSATRIFQALRIAVNEELSSIKALLDSVPMLLANSGKAAFITFHSLEDRLVKQTMRKWENGGQEKEDLHDRSLFMLPLQITPWGKETPRGGITPSENEQRTNSRSRSARLRVFQFGERLVRQGSYKETNE